MGSKPMTTEQSTFMVDLHQVGMMLRYVIEGSYYSSLRQELVTSGTDWYNNMVPAVWSPILVSK